MHRTSVAPAFPGANAEATEFMLLAMMQCWLALTDHARLGGENASLDAIRGHRQQDSNKEPTQRQGRKRAN